MSRRTGPDMSGGAASRQVQRRAFEGRPAELPVVYVCGSDVERAPYVGALRDRALVRLAESLADLEERIRAESSIPAVVILPARDRSGRPAAATVRALAAGAPGVAIVAYCRPAAPEAGEIRALATAGVHEFLFVGTDDGPGVIRAVLDTARRESAAETVFAALRPLLPPRMRDFADCCLANPTEARTVAGVARLLGVHRKTLFNRCAQEGLPPPQELIAWCRLMLVAHLMTHTMRTIEGIAVDLEFASASALRNMMRRYTGLTATEVRDRGGVACMLAAFSARVAGAARGGKVG